MIFGYKLIKKDAVPTAENADLWTGKAEIDREEEEFLARKAASGKSEGSWFYRHFVSWLF